MEKSKVKSNLPFQKLGWFGVFACGCCCTLPIIGTIAGMGAFTALSAFSEIIGIVVLGMAGIIFALHFY